MSERERLLHIKRELIATTNTRGWTYVKQISENVIAAAVQLAIDEEDETKATIARRKAKAMQDGLRAIFAAIEATKMVDDSPEPGWFADLDKDFQDEVSEVLSNGN